MTKQRFFWGSEAAHEHLLTLLQQGGVAIASSDTVIGLLAPLTDQGYRALNSLKKREHKPYVVLIADSHKASLLVDMPIKVDVQGLMDACWPGPVTFICKAREAVPVFMKSPEGTIALRVPNHVGLQQILAQVDGLFSTSANRQGEPVARTFKEIDSHLLKSINTLIMDPFDSPVHPKQSTKCCVEGLAPDYANATPDTQDDPFDSQLLAQDDRCKCVSVPSTIIDCTGDVPRVVREGAYPIEALEKAYGGQFKKNS